MLWLTKAMPSYLLLLGQSDLGSDSEPNLTKIREKPCLTMSILIVLMWRHCRQHRHKKQGGIFVSFQKIVIFTTGKWEMHRTSREVSISHPYSDPMNTAKGQNIPTLLSHILSSASRVIWNKSLNFPVPQIPGL